jgi:pimeloyl-ACP methyl ester carboxylesterase
MSPNQMPANNEVEQASSALMPLQWQQGGRDFLFRGHRLFTRSEGNGPTLLLIHGFPTSSWDWARLWPELAKNHRVLTLDMLGFGRSDKPRDFDYSIHASADQVQAFVVAQDMQATQGFETKPSPSRGGLGGDGVSVDILAHDYGDSVAQELLARQREGALPFRIRAVVFLNGGLFPEAHFPLPLQKALLGPFGPLIAWAASYRTFAANLRRICACPLDEAELREHWRLIEQDGGKRIMPKLIRYIGERRVQRQRWLEALTFSIVPTRLIDGTEDPISGRSLVTRYRELVPDADVVELPGVGHYPQIEAPAAVLAAASEFFAQVSGRAPL